jgi:hypothetical protein
MSIGHEQIELYTMVAISSLSFSKRAGFIKISGASNLSLPTIMVSPLGSLYSLSTTVVS